jgi:DnaK suppressor protein
MAQRKPASQKTTPKASKSKSKGGPNKTSETSASPVQGTDLKDTLTRLTSRRRSGSGGNKKGQLLIFTVEDAREELARIRMIKVAKAQEQAVLQPKPSATTAAVSSEPAPKARVVAAASLMDILGFDPTASSGNKEEHDREKVPSKWLEFYDSLLELRRHFKEELEIHTKDSLALDGSDDSSRYSGYGSEQTDSDSGQFDREIAINMLAHEQDALFEIEEALRRIMSDRYGVCEITGKSIPKPRLRAVPFTRYSIEGQMQLESRSRLGSRGADTFLERDDDSPKMMASDDDED